MKMLLTFATLLRKLDYGSVVQLVRIPACHAGGRGFESRPDRLRKRLLQKCESLFCFNHKNLVVYNSCHAIIEGESRVRVLRGPLCMARSKNVEASFV